MYARLDYTQTNRSTISPPVQTELRRLVCGLEYANLKHYESGKRGMYARGSNVLGISTIRSLKSKYP